MAPEDIESDDELRGSMGASAVAKSNTNIFKRIISPMENANIILMCVNHLTQKIELTPVKSKAQVNFLKQDETIPGGRAVTYLSNTLVKLEPGSKLDPDKEIKVKGFYIVGTLIKSRNNEAGRQFKMVFEPSKGINNLLTNLVNLKDLGRITGAARSFKLDTCPDIKFSLGEFTEKYESEPELREAFDKAVDEEYRKLIDFSIISGESKQQYMDEIICEDILVKVNSNENLYKHKYKDKFYQKNEDGIFIEVEVEIE
jgi:hypothetical protein